MDEDNMMKPLPRAQGASKSRSITLDSESGAPELETFLGKRMDREEFETETQNDKSLVEDEEARQKR